MTNELELSARRIHKSFEERQGSFHNPRTWASLSSIERNEFIALANYVAAGNDQPLDQQTTTLCRTYNVPPTSENKAYFNRRINET